MFFQNVCKEAIFENFAIQKLLRIWYKISSRVYTLDIVCHLKISFFRSQCDDVDSLTGVNVTCYRDSFLEINIDD